MGSEWKTYHLEELCEFVNGFAFKSSDYVPKSADTIEVFRMGYIGRGGGFKEDDSPVFVPRKYSRNLDKFLLRSGDITIAMTDMKDRVAILGNTAWIRASNRFVLNQRVGCMRVKRTDLLDAKFLYFYSNWSPHVDYLRSRANSGVQVNLTSDAIKQVDILIPPIPEQRAIAHILGTLDDKIELNRKMNETLESMARAIFKSWFMDFDPVRAKAEGRDPGLPKLIADLFPDSFEDSELGEIPKGWRVGSIDDEFDLTMGQSPPGETYNEAGVGLPFYQGCTDFGFRFPTRRIYCSAPTRYGKAGDTLVSVRAPVGDINIATEDCAIGRGVAAVRHKTGSRSYSYQFMQSIEEVFARFEAEGTVFGSIGKKDFHAIACANPPRELVLTYEARVASLDDRVDVNERESRTLAALRDALLPKLVSGELRVKDAEKIVGRMI